MTKRAASRQPLLQLKLSFLTVLLLLFMLSGTAAAAEYVMKIAIGNPPLPNHYGWTTFQVFKQQLESLSQGRVKVELYPELMGASSLEKIDDVRDGVVQARDFADGHLATVYPPIQVLSIPYLFLEREIAWKVLDGPFGQQLIEDMAAKTGLRPLFWIENGGFRHFSNNKRAIHSPADMKGLVFRTMESPLHVKIVMDLGARGIPISWALVYEAIEAGIVDGQENSIGTFLIPQFEKIQKYLTLDGHFYATYTLLMNDAWYQSLPADIKDCINKAKRVAATANRGLSISNEINNLKYLEQQGVEVYTPTLAEKKQFQQLTRASAIAWLGQNVGTQWVEEVLRATAAAEAELGYR